MINVQIMKHFGLKSCFLGTFIVVWAHVTLSCASFLIVPLLPIFFAFPVRFRHIFDMISAGPLVTALGGICEYLMGVKIVITGDRIPPGERSLIIMNHRTCLDWCYLWSVLARESGTHAEKIVLQAPVKRLPGAGWAMQVTGYIFLEQKWEKDKIIMDKFIKYYSDIGYKTQVMLFPEGRDLTEFTRKQDDEFAKKNNLKHYEYVLHPRTTGFTFLTTQMQQNNHLDAVYDLTISYPDHIPQKAHDLLVGNFPKEVHFHIKRYAAESLPTTENGLDQWLIDRWAEKEKRLREFYQNPKLAYKDADEQPRINSPPPLMKFLIFYWSLIVLITAWMLYNFVFIRYCAVLQIVFFLVISHKYNGFEMFQIDYYNRFFKTNRLSPKTKQS